MNESLLVELFEEPIGDGEFRTKNDAGERFRPNLIDRGNRLVTKVDIVGITHGRIASTNSFGTLLVFEFRFLANEGHRFKRAAVTIKFEDGAEESVPSRDPVVLSIAPGQKYALNRTERVQLLKWGANAGVNVGIEAAGAEAGLQWEMEQTRTRKYFTAFSGVKRNLRKGWTGRDNAVIWTLEENHEAEDGIPTLARTAVLLSRPQDVPFSFAVKVQTDVDFSGQLRTLFGLERKDPIDPVEIDPSASANHGIFGAAISTLDPQLHNLQAMDQLDLFKVAEVGALSVVEGTELGEERGQ